MPGHRRVKDVGYDDDDVDDYYSDDDGDYAAGGGGGEVYTAEDKENFATLTPVVKAELQEAGLQASDREVEDALWNYYWDVGKSVNYLKNARQPKKMAPKEVKEKAKSKFDEAQEKNAAKSADVTTTKTQPKSKGTTGLEKKTHHIKLDAAASKPAQASLPKVKSKNLDVPKLWAEGAASRKRSAAFVVIGHVDHGKSTLMGRLLLDTGAVAQRDIDKFRKQAEEIGKSSFALAWVMDTAADERERGVTVDIAQHHFSTPQADFTILDAPGHRDFVPNMIGGASMADLGVLVVDANQLESGLKGQTREHVLLARAVGLRKMIVAVNKMDGTTPAWDRETFASVTEQVEKLLKDAGFAPQDVKTVPCSGLKGDNVVSSPPTEGATAWVAGETQTLISSLEAIAGATHIPDEPIAKPFRMQITDTFRGSIQNPVSVAGRVSSGNVQVGDILMIQPSGEQAVVKSIEIANEGSDYAVAGQIATLHLDGDAETLERNVRASATMCSSKDPVQVVNDFTALLTVEETLLPSAVDLHLGRLHVPAKIAGLLELVDAKREVTKRKPRVVKPGQRVRVAIKTDEAIPVEAGDRTVLRSNSATVASGAVENTHA